jgi:hypothetical protein
MRIKLGKGIHTCTKATHPDNSKLLILTTSNDIYTVDCNSQRVAEEIMNMLRVDGHYDFSAYKYINSNYKETIYD